MTAEQEVIWECFLMRRERDLEWLWQGQQAGDPLGRKFFTGLGGWLEKCRNTPVDEAPQCLTCKQTFCDPTQMPLTFLVTHSEDPRISALALTGVCWRCAEKSDTELLKHGTELTAKFLKAACMASATRRHRPRTRCDSRDRRGDVGPQTGGSCRAGVCKGCARFRPSAGSEIITTGCRRLAAAPAN